MKTIIDYTNKLKDYFLALTDDNWKDITDLIGVKIPKPTVVVDEYYYNGQPQGPTISGSDPKCYTVTNETNVERGTYTCTISLKKSCVWNDDTTDDINIEYSIGVGIADKEG